MPSPKTFVAWRTSSWGSSSYALAVDGSVDIAPSFDFDRCRTIYQEALP
jgi:hypothetical protein